MKDKVDIKLIELNLPFDYKGTRYYVFVEAKGIYTFNVRDIQKGIIEVESLNTEWDSGDVNPTSDMLDALKEHISTQLYVGDYWKVIEHEW